MLLEKYFGMTYPELMKLIVTYGMKLVMAGLVLFIGFWLAGFLSKTVRKIMQRGDADANLVGFVSSLVGGLVKLLVAVTAITQLGIEMTSFVAILASAGLAIGMAFSGTLSNFAGGVMILLFKPFRSGDSVMIQNLEGTIKEITIFNTIMTTSDNKLVILPNGPVSNGTIINYSTNPERRVEWRIPIASASDFPQAKEIVTAILNENEDILQTKAPFIGLSDLSVSPHMVVVQAWTTNGQNTRVFYEMNVKFYNAFLAANIPSPSSSMEVKISN